MTAMTYAEAATNFPEAGGSSSFARRAFNELVSFFAAWGQMLNYIITVAISAFFVPHYLAVFWEPLGESPGDVIGGIVIVVLLSAINIVGVTESARLNFLLAVDRLRDAAAAPAARRLPGPQLRDADRQHPPVDGAHGRRFRALDHDRDDLLHRHRDDLEPRGGGPRAAQADPARDGVRRAGRDGDLHAACRRSRCRRCRSPRRATRHTTELATTYAGRPDPRDRREHEPRRLPDRAEVLRRRPGRHDPA